MKKSTNSKYAKLVAGLLTAALSLTACATNSETTTDNSGGSGGSQSSGFKLAKRISEKAKNGEKLVIKLSYHNPSLAFAAPIAAGMNRAGSEFGVDVQLVGPAGGDPAAQVAEIQTLITQGKIDGLAVSSASNDALKPVIAQAFDAGIPIISFNTNNPDSKQLGFVGQDLKASGATEGKELLKALNGKTGDVVVVSVDTGAGWSNDRFSGFKDALAGSGNNIIGPVNTGNEPTGAYNTVESTMAGNANAIAVASLDCCSFIAAGTWVKQHNKVGSIVLTGFDLQTQTIENIRNNVASFTIGQAPEEQGYQAVKVLRDFIVDGTKIADVDTGTDIYTKANIDSAPAEG